MKYIFSVICVFLIHLLSYSQTGIIKGTVKDKLTNSAIIGANVLIVGTDIGTSTDLDGNYIIEGLKPGIYDLQISYIGYEKV